MLSFTLIKSRKTLKTGTFLTRSSSCNKKVLSILIMLSFTLMKSQKVLEVLELRILRILNPRKLKITYSIKTNSNMLDSTKRFLKHYLVFDCKEAWTSFKFKIFLLNSQVYSCGWCCWRSFVNFTKVVPLRILHGYCL